MKKLIFIALLLFSLLSCVTGDLTSRIHTGMTKDEVINILGSPDEYESQGKYEALKFTKRVGSGWPWKREDYSVIFRDDRAVEFGPGMVRKDFDANIIFIAPLE
jgi:hypothetical protein